MKICLIAFILCPLFAYGADYGGADKYPVQTKTGGSYFLVVAGADIQSYDLQAKAEYAASQLSLKCACEVSIRQPTIKYSTIYKSNTPTTSSSKSSVASSARSSSASSKSSVVSSSAISSNKSSVVAQSNFKNGYIEWEPQHQRIDSSAVEIQFFIVWQLSHKDQSTYQFTTLPASARSYDVNPMNGYLLIAAQDFSGIRSDFIPIYAREKI